MDDNRMGRFQLFFLFLVGCGVTVPKILRPCFYSGYTIPSYFGDVKKSFERKEFYCR